MGFDPIISTCSQHNIEYVKAAGATHVIDYAAVPYASLPEAVRKITQKPVTIVFDAISVEETQNAGWAVLAPGGSIVVMLHPYVGNWGAEAEDGKRTVWPFANVNLPEHRVFGKLVYEKLGEYLQKGIIKVCLSDGRAIVFVLMRTHLCTSRRGMKCFRVGCTGPLQVWRGWRLGK